MTRSLLSEGEAGAFAGLALGGDLKPGQKVPVFHPLLVTGPSAGEKQCPV
jgi:hypothetical protein